MQAQNDVLKLLVENAEQIGMVTESMCDRMVAWTSYFSSDEEEMNETAGGKSKTLSPEKKKKRRGSLKGGQHQHMITNVEVDAAQLNCFEITYRY